MTDTAMTLDELVRLAHGLTQGHTQQQVAEDVGLTQSRISEALRGRSEAALVAIVEHYTGQSVRRCYVLG